MIRRLRPSRQRVLCARTCRRCFLFSQSSLPANRFMFCFECKFDIIPVHQTQLISIPLATMSLDSLEASRISRHSFRIRIPRYRCISLCTVERKKLLIRKPNRKLTLLRFRASCICRWPSINSLSKASKLSTSYEHPARKFMPQLSETVTRVGICNGELYFR